VVYALVGLLAIEGAGASGLRGALVSLQGGPFGFSALVAIAAGLAAYGFWRLAAAWLDVSGFGRGLSGVAARLVIALTGVAHLLLAAFATYLAALVEDYEVARYGEASVVRWFLEQPFGWPVFVAIGAGVAGAGVFFVYKGLSPAFYNYVAVTPMARRLAPLGRLGLLAYGAVLIIVGGFLGWAGWTTDASEVGGFDEAFAFVRHAPYGRWLLTALGAGLIGFSVFCLIHARFRTVPGYRGHRAAAPDPEVARTREEAWRAPPSCRAGRCG
jgi:hypothetical protein